ncbi:NAD(P)H-binding protein [Cellulophaga sp. Z1A5H]|uniref:NAD(P)H-binding protein n=1 Tax=Cellulophaga sp. Z1A5H TaxID=2687291 RepID=UPI0013FDB1CE|nr:NAD(P)H-binding protein [Cellulophaga sp. Z1A5H]
MNNTVGILGCGWLGLPLAKTFIKNEFLVKGTTTSEEKLKLLNEAGIQEYKIKLSENGIVGPIRAFLANTKTLVINVPPKLRGTNTENYVAKMTHLAKALEKSEIKQVIFVSSTAVYGDIKGVVTEKTKPEPNTESGIQLLVSENIFKENKKLQTTIIRFGGLLSEDRHPVTMLVKRKGLKNGGMPVNLIHREDCIRVILKVIEENWWNVSINGVYPEHPSKKEYYSEAAIKRGLNLPDYEDNKTENSKIIAADYLINVKDFQFLTSIKK